MPHDKFMEKLSKADKLLRQFPQGIRAVEFAEKMGVHRTQAYDYLNGLRIRGKAHSEDGLWFPKDEKESPKRFGFFEWLERRAERKRLEKERAILELDVEVAALKEEAFMTHEEYNSKSVKQLQEERIKRRQKYRELLKRS